MSKNHEQDPLISDCLELLEEFVSCSDYHKVWSLLQSQPQLLLLDGNFQIAGGEPVKCNFFQLAMDNFAASDSIMKNIFSIMVHLHHDKAVHKNQFLIARASTMQVSPSLHLSLLVIDADVSFIRLVKQFSFLYPTILIQRKIESELFEMALDAATPRPDIQLLNQIRSVFSKNFMDLLGQFNIRDDLDIPVHLPNYCRTNGSSLNFYSVFLNVRAMMTKLKAAAMQAQTEEPPSSASLDVIYLDKGYKEEWLPTIKFSLKAKGDLRIISELCDGYHILPHLSRIEICKSDQLSREAYVYLLRWLANAASPQRSYSALEGISIRLHASWMYPENSCRLCVHQNNCSSLQFTACMCNILGNEQGHTLLEVAHPKPCNPGVECD